MQTCQDVENDPITVIPYMVICFSYCDLSNNWNTYSNITYSCTETQTDDTYEQKINLIVKEADALLKRIKHNHPGALIKCEGYAIEGVVDQNDHAPYLCQKLGAGFVDNFEC
jgi:hypothetical protein